MPELFPNNNLQDGYSNYIVGICNNLQIIATHLQEISQQQKERNEILQNIDTNLQNMNQIKDTKD